MKVFLFRKPKPLNFFSSRNRTQSMLKSTSKVVRRVRQNQENSLCTCAGASPRAWQGEDPLLSLPKNGIYMKDPSNSKELK